MDDRLSRLESAVQGLEQSLGAVEHRLAALERRIPADDRARPPAPTETIVPSTGASHLPVSRDEFITVVSFIGRTFVALGGAYLLRALTDSAILPRAAGIALGLAYALSWLVVADRAGAKGRRLSASFHGLVAAVIAFPLLYEATTRFTFLGPEAAAAGLTLVTAFGLAIAARQQLQGLAWIVTAAALATALALIAATALVVPFAIFLILLGVTTLWLGYAYEWILLRWPVALGADLAVLAMWMRVSSGGWPEPPGRIVAVQLFLLTGYLASIAVRTLVRGRDVNAFEVVQTVAALTVGFGGAVYVAQATGAGAARLALVNLVFGAGCYGVAFAFVAKRQGLRRNFYFYTSLALVLVLFSSTLLLDSARLALSSATLAVLTTWLAARVGRVTLNLHGAVYVIAAASASGLLGSATRALVGQVTPAEDLFAATPLVALAATAVCWAIPMSATESWGIYSRLPRLFITLALVWALGGRLVEIAIVTGGRGAGVDAGVVATIRTGILAGAALALAWAGRRDRFRESGWLLYPVLVAGGVKLLVEDLQRSQPSTLFVALALYGGALIVAPRIGHSPRA